jgi:hypothetical protein
MACGLQDLQTQTPFPFSPSEVQFRDQGDPVFLCSSVVRSADGASTIPGMMTVRKDQIAVKFAHDSSEHDSNITLRVLIDTKNMRWVCTSKGAIPVGCRPVFGGFHEPSGDLFYHCAVWWKGQRVPGLVQASQEFACITWNGRVWMIASEYELLCWE